MTRWFRIATLRALTLGWLLVVGLTACGGGGEDAGAASDSTGPLASKSVATVEPAVELQHLLHFNGHELLVPGEQVIRSEAEWQAFWSQHPDNFVPTLEGVDFSQQMLLAVTRFASGCGLHLKITSVAADSAANGPGWVAGFELGDASRPAGMMCPDIALTAVDIVVWPRSDAPVRFVNLGPKS